MRYARVAGLLALLPLSIARAATTGHHTRILENLYDTKFVSADEGWVAGAFGVIYHTTDGGSTWQSEVTHTDQQLFGIDFADAKNGWVVGRAGTILHTSDGSTWSPQTSGTDKHLFEVKALSAENVWAVGDWGAIFRTTDGGNTWQNVSLKEDVILNDICFADAKHGWIAGEAGAIFATTDGGLTWTRQDSGAEKSLFGVDFSDDQHGWAVGLDSLILHTSNGGQTWEVQRGDPKLGSLEQMGFLEALKNPSLYAVRVVNNLGVVVGDMGTILMSNDGGGTWQPQKVPPEWKLRWVRGVSLVPGTHGLVVGSAGLAIPVSDGHLRFPRK